MEEEKDGEEKESRPVKPDFWWSVEIKKTTLGFTGGEGNEGRLDSIN